MERQKQQNREEPGSHENVAERQPRSGWQVGEMISTVYQVTAKLGEGGMGVVHQVHHLQSNRNLAVKSPRPEIFSRPEGKENFVREAETWVKLGKHANIVSCYYVRTLDGLPRIFIEYIEGGSLTEWIRHRRLYTGGQEVALERILDVAIQFAWGLHFAHEQGLVHQDVKPANVLMTADGIPKVTDFGLARARVLAGEGSLPPPEQEQSLLASWGGMTPAYCSPEQEARHPLSRKTDIWSWAVSVLQMFLGQVTWQRGATAREALARHRQLDAAIPAMPPAVVKLLGHCLQPQPQDRPATMLEVATELAAIYESLAGHPYPREAPQAVEVRADVLNNQASSLFELGHQEEVLTPVNKRRPLIAPTIYDAGLFWP